MCEAWVVHVFAGLRIGRGGQGGSSCVSQFVLGSTCTKISTIRFGDGEAHIRDVTK